MAPPTTGPRTLEMAKMDVTMVMYVANLAGGTIRGTINVDSEYIPEPPIPWRARKMILMSGHDVQVRRKTDN